MRNGSNQARSSALLLLVFLAMAVPAGGQLWTAFDQLLATSVPGSYFGEATAAGDFDNDGYADLAFSGSSASFSNLIGPGEVRVAYGSSSGLGSIVFFRQGLNGLAGTAEDVDHFGYSLAAGDFNGDGFADLAIGTPFEDVPFEMTTYENGGVVQVIYGGADGLNTTGDQLFSQGTDGVLGTLETDDGFGYALAAGNFNGDGFRDLAIGVAGEGVNGNQGAGAVAILYGSAAGLTATGDELITQTAAGELSEPGDGFGGRLASGDFNSDGRDDLAIAAAGEDVNLIEDAGSASVLLGSVGGLVTPGLYLHQGAVIPGGTLPGTPAEFEYFGASLAAGDFNRVTILADPDDDLAIGVLSDAPGNEGSVEILNGSSTGITGAGSYVFGPSDLPSADPANYEFGATLHAARFHGGLRDDLVVGEPRFGANQPGRTYVIPGSSSGLLLDETLTLACDTPGLDCALDQEDLYFGTAFASGNFDGKGNRDLAIGVPGHAETPGDNAGAIEILFSALFAADTETSDPSEWSSTSP